MTEDNNIPPAVSVTRSELGDYWLVEVFTNETTGPIAIDVNEGRVWHDDPEAPTGTAALLTRFVEAYEELDGDVGNFIEEWARRFDGR